MTVQIDTTAVINAVKLTQQNSHPSAPAAGSELLYVISGSNNGGLFLKDSGGRQIGPFITGTSSGGGPTLLKSFWSIDAPPTSPSVYDDEFNDGSFNTSLWGTSDPNSKLTKTESSTYKNLQIVHAPHAGATDDVTGIYQTIPAGDFTIWICLDRYSQLQAYSHWGLALWEDATNTAKKIQMFTIVDRDAGYQNLGINTMNNQAGSGKATTWETAVNNHWEFGKAYFRLRRNGSNYYWGFSKDGYGFTEHTTSSWNPSFTPLHFGIVSDNLTGTTTQSTVTTMCNYFRYVASDVGLNGILAGQLAGIYQ